VDGLFNLFFPMLLLCFINKHVGYVWDVQIAILSGNTYFPGKNLLSFAMIQGSYSILW